MSWRTGLFLFLAVAGLFLYLWPALRAPVVLWSDSTLDMEWARRGVGIVSPIPPPGPGEEPPRHPAKPAYLLFLRLVQKLGPSGQEQRTIVVAQSLFLWLSVVGTSLLVLRRRGAAGVALLAALLFLLRIRASANTIMPEALSTALLLPITAGLLDPPRNVVRVSLLGIAIGLLFWVRPNVGVIALILAVAAFALAGRRLGAVVLAAGFFIAFAPIWILTRPDQQGERFRGLGHPIFFGSVDYYWAPGIGTTGGTQSELEHRELHLAASNWSDLLRNGGPDARRQIAWRAAHGLLGTELSSAPFWSRVISPFLTLASISLILGALFRRTDRMIALLGALLILLVVAQNLMIGSNPRFELPLLPPLLLIAAVVARNSLPAAVPISAVLLFAVAVFPHVTDFEWGRIESAGVTIRQRIPRGVLPDRVPATLHVRIAPPLLPSSAHFEIRSSTGLLYRSTEDSNRQRPVVTVPLPRALLDANSRRSIELELSSFGSYGEQQYLLFPVIPPPWRKGARRDGSAQLSPSTGIPAGSLDWWAHAGAE